MIHKTLIAETATGLDEKINAHLNDDWELYGDHHLTVIQATLPGNIARLIYSQGMTKIAYFKTVYIDRTKEFRVYHEPVKDGGNG